MSEAYCLETERPPNNPECFGRPHQQVGESIRGIRETELPVTAVKGMEPRTRHQVYATEVEGAEIDEHNLSPIWTGTNKTNPSTPNWLYLPGVPGDFTEEYVELSRDVDYFSNSWVSNHEQLSPSPACHSRKY
ncbi:hypothetical protein DFH09DRAFT_1067747 [Mycena vulgaris]|nr:hypothetical protein DFH09DRAFT_1067747 [Mycena vulgaris]